jgi:hypothetical protein
MPELTMAKAACSFMRHEQGAAHEATMFSGISYCKFAQQNTIINGIIHILWMEDKGGARKRWIYSFLTYNMRTFYDVEIILCHQEVRL